MLLVDFPVACRCTWPGWTVTALQGWVTYMKVAVPSCIMLCKCSDFAMFHQTLSGGSTAVTCGAGHLDCACHMAVLAGLLSESVLSLLGREPVSIATDTPARNSNSNCTCPCLHQRAQRTAGRLRACLCHNTTAACVGLLQVVSGGLWRCWCCCLDCCPTPTKP